MGVIMDQRTKLITCSDRYKDVCLSGMNTTRNSCLRAPIQIYCMTGLWIIYRVLGATVSIAEKCEEYSIRRLSIQGA